MFTNELEEYGYNVYWKVLNSKHYGVPQNRERVYLILIKKELDNGTFKFPEPFDNGIRLKNILENDVDEKYYISKDKVEKILIQLESNSSLLYDSCQAKREGKVREYNDFSPTLTSRDYKEPRLINDNTVQQVDNIVDTGNWDNPQRGRIYLPDGLSPSLNCCGGGGGGLEPKVILGIDKSYHAPKIIENANCLTAREDRGISNRKMEGTAVLECSSIGVKQAPKKGYIECKIGGVADLSYPNSDTRRGRVQENVSVAPTITATETGVCKIETPTRIRKLIPLEAFRLMGFSDEQFYKAMIGLEDKAKNFIQENQHLIGKTILNEAETIQGISNSQLYKMAGNSIVVDVLFYILMELYTAMPYLFDDLKLSSFFSGIGAFEVALDRLYDEIKLLRK